MEPTSKLNPYAVSPTSEQPSVPIRFRGILTRDDWLISKADSPPASTRRRIGSAVTTFILVVICVLLMFGLASQSDTDSSFLWIIVGIGVLPAWFRFALRVTPGKRARNRRLKALSKHATEKFGWMNNRWIVQYDHHTAIRGNWSLVSNALVFPTHQLLPQVADNNRRIVLPWRFFGSYQDVMQSIEILHAKVGVLINRPPTEKDFTSDVSEEALSEVDVESPPAWDFIHWPFPPSSDDEEVFTLDPTRGRHPIAIAAQVAVTMALILTWIFLPVFVGLVIWLATQYQQFGGWDFVFYQPLIAGLGLVPAVGLVAFAIYRSIIGAHAALKFQATPLRVCLRPEGLHVSKHNFDSWLRWSAIEGVIANTRHAGWISAETEENVRFAQTCFASAQDFARFKSALLRYGPSAKA